MNSIIKAIACCVILAWISSLTEGRPYIPPNKYQSGEGEVEFVTGSPDGGYDGPEAGPKNVFKDWMKFIQGFFKDGNWENGGPANFARFIGNQVSKLVEILTKDDNKWFNSK